jgi:hypothetical protein
VFIPVVPTLLRLDDEPILVCENFAHFSSLPLLIKLVYPRSL